MAALTLNGTDQMAARLATAAHEAVEATLGSIGCPGLAGGPSATPPKPCTGMIGTICFTGEVAWAFSLILPRETAAGLAHLFTGMDLEYDGPDMADAIGELANVVAGDIIARLAARRINTQMSLPEVARGEEVEIVFPADPAPVVLDFESGLGAFHVKVVTGKEPTKKARMPGK